MNLKNLSDQLTKTAYKAGQTILDIYQEDIKVEIKADNSPVTLADKEAENIILKDLKAIAPDIPVIAEEAAQDGNLPDTSGKTFFLVDPLDGTKEFIKKTGQFTVNIGLIENGIPVFGLIYAPALQQLYLTPDKDQAAMATLDCQNTTFQVTEHQTITTRAKDEDGLIVATSRSHMDTKTSDFLKNYKIKQNIAAGSSLKFCLLAKGEADLYPRFGRTMEWDTAAGHAILSAAGGCVISEDGSAMKYGKRDQSYANPGFIAWSLPDAPRQ
ncbi:MAG: 3'(2'),5'-bisphosphate nucleotidase CysQ [Pseudomonadota bacterium]